MISHTQTLEGITSLVSKEENKHIPMWDLDNCTLDEAKKTLKSVQKKYKLSHIYLISDKEGSYRALCFSQVDFKTFCKMLEHSSNLGKAT